MNLRKTCGSLNKLATSHCTKVIVHRNMETTVKVELWGFLGDVGQRDTHGRVYSHRLSNLSV